MGKATQKMQDYAAAIAEYLGIDPPDFDDFEETRDFIDENKDEYWYQRRECGDCD